MRAFHADYIIMPRFEGAIVSHSSYVRQESCSSYTFGNPTLSSNHRPIRHLPGRSISRTHISLFVRPEFRGYRLGGHVFAVKADQVMGGKIWKASHFSHTGCSPLDTHARERNLLNGVHVLSVRKTSSCIPDVLCASGMPHMFTHLAFHYSTGIYALGSCARLDNRPPVIFWVKLAKKSSRN